MSLLCLVPVCAGGRAGRQLPIGVIALLLLCLAPLRLASAQAGRDRYHVPRVEMVREYIAAEGITNPHVLEAMRSVPRHEFVRPSLRRHAYRDHALDIGHKQTISPPYIVAYMTETLDPQPEDRVLEIGTGSGYQAAVLSGLVREVYTIEIVVPLGRQAARTLKRLHYDNVHTKIGDGFKGWPERAPFDKIIVTCSPELVPRPLIDQLKEGGRMVVPVGQRYQQTLYLLKKTDGKMVSEKLRPTLFVPMTGRAEDARQVLPDPTKPELANGDFEKTIGDPPRMAGWHYVRQAELVTDEHPPSGDAFVTFENVEPGRGCRALQGFAVDGRKVTALDFAMHVRGEGIRPGQNIRQMPLLAVTFYDERRAEVGHGVLGPWRGTFPWREETGRIKVPPRAREAIIRIGLHGAIGKISFDDIRMTGVTR